MEPTITTALTILGKAFSIGSAAYKVRQSWGLNADELSAIASLASAGAATAEMFAGSSATPMLALHTALVTRAFGAACHRHWGGSKAMAPGLDKPSRLRRIFLSKSELDRRADIESRLRMAFDAASTPGEGAPEKNLNLITALVSDPQSSPCYRALWTAFTNPLLEDGEQASLVELADPGARLEFEQFFRLAYAEAVAAPGAAGLAKYMVELEADRPRLLRRLIAGRVSTWKDQHVFGETETPGVPNMPLGQIYVEPDGVYKQEETARREPIRSLVKSLLEEHAIVIVRGDFGHGKSLTAKTLACEWAEIYLTDRTTTSGELVYPLFIKCGVDFLNHEPKLDDVIPRALRNQAEALKLDFHLDKTVLAGPPSTERVIYLIDGLDEVALTQSEIDDFFKHLRDHAGGPHRAVIFSRKGVIPREDQLRGIPVIDVQQLRTEGPPEGGQVAEWLERWNALSGAPPITAAKLAGRGLSSIVTTPIVLFMAALTWDDERAEGASVTRAEIYERFFRQIAAGKCDQDRDVHGPVVEASKRLLARLVEHGEIEKPSTLTDEAKALPLAMLWLMARIAWEGQRCEQRGEVLTLHDVTSVLRNDLGVRSQPADEEMIRLGVLLVLQADHHGSNDRVLFGHKSFREFLIGRYWATRLKRIVAERSGKERARLEKQLLGARLLGESYESFDFLMQVVDGVEWNDREREKLIDWASECFNDETPDFASPELNSWLGDRRPVLREAAVAIGSGVRKSPGIVAETPTTLRSLLAWFWLAAKSPMILASRANLQGASLQGANLYGANLQGANLGEADLQKANLYGVNLHGAKLREAHLQFANLYGARLQSADLHGAKLQWANLQGAYLQGANLQEANLQEANLRGANLRGANLQGANLRGANLRGADFREADLHAADLRGADLREADLNGASLEGADTQGAIFEGSKGVYVQG